MAADALNVARDNILQWMEKGITSIESTLNERLKEMAGNFEKEFNLTADLEERLRTPLRDEELLLTTINEKETNMVYLRLEECMEKIKKDVAMDEEILAALWADWARIQTDIASVGIEVLGLDAFSYSKDSIPEQVLRALADATERHRGQTERYHEHEQSITELQVKARALKVRNEQRLKAQQKVRVQL